MKHITKMMSLVGGLVASLFAIGCSNQAKVNHVPENGASNTDLAAEPAPIYGVQPTDPSAEPAPIYGMLPDESADPAAEPAPIYGMLPDEPAAEMPEADGHPVMALYGMPSDIEAGPADEMDQLKEANEEAQPAIMVKYGMPPELIRQ